MSLSEEIISAAISLHVIAQLLNHHQNRIGIQAHLPKQKGTFKRHRQIFAFQNVAHFNNVLHISDEHAELLYVFANPVEFVRAAIFQHLNEPLRPRCLAASLRIVGCINTFDYFAAPVICEHKRIGRFVQATKESQSMTQYDLTGAITALLITRTKGTVSWLTAERVWPPPQWKPVIGGMPMMLTGSVFFWNRHLAVSEEVARYGLN